MKKNIYVYIQETERKGKKREVEKTGQPPSLLYYSFVYQCIPDRPSCVGLPNHGQAADREQPIKREEFLERRREKESRGGLRVSVLAVFPCVRARV